MPTGFDGEGATPVRFSVVCVAGQVSLRLADGTGPPPQLLPMALCWGCRWEITVPLRSGVYRYRYFVRDGDVTVSMPPTSSDESDVDGLDGLLRIPGPNRGSHADVVPPESGLGSAGRRYNGPR